MGKGWHRGTGGSSSSGGDLEIVVWIIMAAITGFAIWVFFALLSGGFWKALVMFLACMVMPVGKVLEWWRG